ncbi:efflux RND transporter periplasmic adaptor subunit [Rhodospira trueperi]|uniref:RND family efflux transporter, MFP subunit n=1 Tax=Rhodospira trueperi TaxID=69960 RepID=A0A1G7B2Q6_9PROT|nr:efflux RND transporter periplasmic adaptor subunit [Rhodospira trueperi]SDE20546.1 RND family efflux transporter, MFP subunit [Rhodospira trueperi]
MFGFVARHWRKSLVIPPVLLGIVLILGMAQGKTPPVRAEGMDAARPARVISVPAVDLVPRATGFGQVTPEHVWQAVAQVAGRVVEVHPRLKRGAILPEGTVVARIDPSSYELTLREREAELRELDIDEENARASIAIQERAVQVARRDLERQRDLRGSGAASQAALDQAETALLSAEQSLQTQRNALNLIPVQRSLVQARLDQAQLDVENTALTAPFDIRVGKVNVAESQFATVGQVLAEGDSIDVAEVEAQFTFTDLAPLMHDVTMTEMRRAAGADDMGTITEVDAVVRLLGGGEVAQVVEWPASLVRVSDTVDPQTRTFGVIVAVEGSYDTAKPGVRPPLVKNMFVQVALRGRPVPGVIVVPRLTLHGDHVYVLDDDDRLEKRRVQVHAVQGDLAVVAHGLTEGDRLVVSDLIPAVEGMLIDPRPDPDERARLIAAAEARDGQGAPGHPHGGEAER